MASIGRVLLIPKGDYSGSATYNSLDWVRDNGAAWVCKVDGTIGIAPPTLPTTSNANWTLMSADGSVSGSVAWSAVTGKPFSTVDSSDFSVDGSSELNINRGTFGTVRVVSDSSGSPTTTDLEASGDAIITLKGGTNVTLSADDSSNPKKITISASGGSGSGTVTSIATGAGLTGGSPTAITTSGTIKCNLKSETASANASENISTTAGRQYAVTPDSNDKLSVNVPWTDTHDIWSSSAQVDSSNQVTFDDLDNSYGYDLYCDDKLIGISAMTKTTGTNTGIKLVYTVTGASQGDTCYLRILR